MILYARRVVHYSMLSGLSCHFAVEPSFGPNPVVLRLMLVGSAS
jgi:hypothetical protein